MDCPHCNYKGLVNSFDVAGACDGCMFCPVCNCEIEQETGLQHEPCPTCLDLLENRQAPRANVTDTQDDSELSL